MLKSKRFNGSMAAVVVLAVILAVVFAGGLTLAWFANSDAGESFFLTGDPVLITLEDEDEGTAMSDDELDLVIPAEYVVPGMQIFPSVYVDVTESTTSALLRAKVNVEATWANAPTELPAGWSIVTAEGEHNGDYTNTTDGSEGTVFVETITDANAYVIEAFMWQQFASKANGWYYNESGDHHFYFVGNGASYSRVMTAASVIAVGGDDYTAAQYAVAGTLLTAGDAYTNQYYNQTVADKALVDGKVASVVTNAEGSVWDEVEGTATYAHVPFLVRPITIPTDWTNSISNATVTISITFEAVQDYLIDPTTSEDLDDAVAVLPNLANAIAVFNDAFGA